MDPGDKPRDDNGGLWAPHAAPFELHDFILSCPQDWRIADPGVS
jgi:hypothetical protein